MNLEIPITKFYLCQNKGYIECLSEDKILRLSKEGNRLVIEQVGWLVK